MERLIFAPERLRRGFTLVELLLVVALISILTAMAVPRFKRAAEELRLRNAAFDLYKLVQFAKENAQTQGRDFCVRFEFSSGTYRLFRRGSSALVPAEGRWGKKTHLSEGLTLRGKKEELYCYPDGRCDEGSVRLAGDEGAYEIAVQNLGSTVSVREVAT